jgi:filamentous hemagglutinin family protein
MSQNSLRRGVLCALSLLCLPLAAQAGIAPSTLPTNGAVVAGQASASVTSTGMTLTVGSGATIIDWGSSGASLNAVSGTGGFDVGSQASLLVTTPGGTGEVLNIDVSGQPSQIDGKITGNGVGVYVANPNGVFVGPNAVISAPTVALLANGASTAEALFNTGTLSASGLATGALSLASGAQINAGNVILSGNGAVNVGNAIRTSNTIDLYGEGDITGSLNANTVNVNGGFYSTGTITANQLNVNLTGYVNDVKTGQILANNFTLDAGSSGTMNIHLTADGSQAQGFNVFVNGNASIDSGTTTVSTASANQNSKLIVVASGDLTVNPGTAANPYGTNAAFQFPGLLYLEGNQGLTVDADLVNAYSTAAPVGYGVFVISPVITDVHSVYANGSRGVNFEGLWNGQSYNAANSINGQNPSTASFSFGVPIYFLTLNYGVVEALPAAQIRNGATGYQQPQNVFFGDVPTLTAGTAPGSGAAGVTPSTSIPAIDTYLLNTPQYQATVQAADDLAQAEQANAGLAFAGNNSAFYTAVYQALQNDLAQAEASNNTYLVQALQNILSQQP